MVSMQTYVPNASYGFGSGASFVVELYGVQNGTQPSSGLTEYSIVHWNQVNESVELYVCSSL